MGYLNGIKIKVLLPSLEEEEVYIQPKEQDASCILKDLFDENQLDGFKIFEDRYNDDYEGEAEECANHLEQLKEGV